MSTYLYKGDGEEIKSFIKESVGSTFSQTELKYSVTGEKLAIISSGSKALIHHIAQKFDLIELDDDELYEYETRAIMDRWAAIESKY